ncbi:efflux RND transporter periplasmic adaptor subunit, partial [Tautonia marina]|uniref:efflux RND transporter periplasmic adaptor subunit n=1 Tax=Tautonia marina TaxID=2653855 RepID=UPI001260D4E5
MNRSRNFRSGQVARLACWMAVIGSLTAARPGLSHDGHAPLPSKGATVQGNQLLLSEPARQAIGVATAKVTLGDLARVVRAQAQVQLPWRQQALITTLIPGRIDRVLARPGDHVEPGQTLALIEGLELETLQREWLRAIAEQRLADRLLAQREELGQSNAITLAEILEARRDAQEAAAGVEVAIRKLLALEISEEDLEEVRETGQPIRFLPIRSPIRGEIVHADVHAGRVVATDEHLFHVVDLSEVDVAGEVLEADLADVRVDQPATATFTAMPGATFSGRIEHTHLTVESATRALTVIAHVENPEHRLKPGMSGLLEIRVGLAEQAIVCPVAAIAGSGDSSHVFLERAAGRFERRAVTLGARSGDRVEVLDGLFPGDRVVVTGTGLLTSLLPATSAGSDRANPGGVRPVSLRPGNRAKADDAASGSRVVALGDVELPVGRRHSAATQVEGRITRILVHPGDRVEKGQVLAEVESLPLHNLQLDLLRTRARHQWASEAAERTRRLSERQAASRVDRWRVETDLEVMDQTIGEIRAKLLSLGLGKEVLAELEASGLDRQGRAASLAMTIPIRAPADGQLEHFDVVPGQVVRPSEPGQSLRPGPLFEIQDRSTLWVCAHVRERDALR